MRSVVLALLLALPGLAAGRTVSFKVGATFENPNPAGQSFGSATAAAGVNLLIADPDAGKVYLYDGIRHLLLRTFVSPRSGYVFGASLAATGTAIFIGEVGTLESDAVVHVFDAMSGALRRTIARPNADFGGFGHPVPFASGKVLIGAPGDLFLPGMGRGGAVYLFDVATGTLLHTFEDPRPDAGDAFGAAVAAVGANVLIGAPQDGATGDQSGAAYLFDGATGALLRTFENPNPPGTYVDPDSTGSNQFGAALAAVGGNVLIGAPDTYGGHFGGRAHLFDGATGALLRTLTSPVAPASYWFGTSVAALGSDLLIGAPRTYTPRDPDPATVFLFDGTTGALLRSFTDPTGAQFAGWGDTVTAVGRDLLIGARNEYPGKAVLFVDGCGDGILDPCEPCDDGNRAGGDGCSAECQLETCGNRTLEAGELCDDGNALDGDGCDANCTPTGCGNCVVTAGEQCDDGGAGCDANCTLAACGNGIVDAGEECDDGNRAGADGCDGNCKREICGNLFLDAGESCDDGNHVDGDGCSAECRRETVSDDWLRLAGTVKSHVFCPECNFGIVLATAGPNIVVGNTGEYPGSVQVFDGDTLALLHLLEAPTPVGREAFGASAAVLGSGILVGSPEEGDNFAGAAHLFDATTGALLRTFTSPAPVQFGGFGGAVAALGTGALVWGGVDHTLYLFDSETGDLLRTFTAPTPDALFGPPLATLGSNVLVGGDGVVYLVDGATGALLHTLRDPGGGRIGGPIVPVGDNVLVGGSAIFLFDGATGAVLRTYPGGFALKAADERHLLVSGPGCDESDVPTAAAYLLDAASGAIDAVLCNPDLVYLTEFGTTGALLGDKVLVSDTYEDVGAVYVFAPCSDGHLVPGEECDDGNLTSGDGCDRNCTVTRCGNAVVTAGEQCDDGNRVSGDGCEPDCTVGPIVTTTSTTTTTATTPTSSTTTTTALAVCTACDDGDPCTIDTCTSEGCRHEALSGWEATQCVCGAIPDVITRRIERAEHLMNLATMTAAPSNARRLRAKAARNFRRAILLAGRAIRRGRISPACAGSLAQTLASELTRARRL